MVGNVKRAANAADEFVNSLQAAKAQQLRADALKDVGSMAALGLGAGAAGRGLVGLINMLKPRPKKVRGGPTTLPLPYPVKVGNYLGDLVAGGKASTKAGIPWYGPAMLGTGMAGLYGGWRGFDAVLQKRRESQMREEMDKARQEFHDALMGSYSRPVAAHPGLVESIKKSSEPSTMEKVGAALDDLFGKVAIDLNNAAGATLGGYGMYAGLSSLLAGAAVYDRMKKRSRRSVLDKALQRRERRKFMQAPTEIMAVPEPVPTPQVPTPNG